jgi:hypothetical protein
MSAIQALGAFLFNDVNLEDNALMLFKVVVDSQGILPGIRLVRATDSVKARKAVSIVQPNVKIHDIQPVSLTSFKRFDILARKHVCPNECRQCAQSNLTVEVHDVAEVEAATEEDAKDIYLSTECPNRKVEVLSVVATERRRNHV